MSAAWFVVLLVLSAGTVIGLVRSERLARRVQRDNERLTQEKARLVEQQLALPQVQQALEQQKLLLREQELATHAKQQAAVEAHAAASLQIARQKQQLEEATVWRHFQNGVTLYDAGQHPEGVRELRLALKLLQPGHSDADGMRQVLADRVLFGGRLLVPPLRHAKAVLSVSFSPDGTRVVTAGHDKTARVWNALTGVQLCRPLVHESAVTIATFSPDGSKIVTGGYDDKLHLWNATDGAKAGEPAKMEGSIVHSVQFSPDGERVAANSGDNGWLWTLAEPTARKLPHKGMVGSIRFSPDGKLIATASWDGTAQLWDGVTGEPRGSALIHTANVGEAEFSPDGQRLVTSCWDRTVQFWDSQTGAKIGDPLLQEEGAGSVKFSPHGERLVVGGSRMAQIWDTRTMTKLGDPMRGTYAHLANFSPDGMRVAVPGEDSIRVCDGWTGASLAEFPGSGRMGVFAFSPDGLRFASIAGTAAHIWDLRGDAQVAPPLMGGQRIYDAQFSPDGTRIVTGSFDETMRLWDSRDGRPMGKPMQHDDAVNNVLFNADGSRLLVKCNGGVLLGDSEFTASLWHGLTGAAICEPLIFDDFIHDCLFTPDGKHWLITVEGRAEIHDAQTGALVGEPLEVEERIVKASFSVDGERVLLAISKTGLQVWNWRTGESLKNPIPCDDSLEATLYSDAGWATFSADGRTIISKAAGGNLVGRWDSRTGAALGELVTLEGNIEKMVFSPDRARFATSSEDGTVRLWDSEALKAVGRPMPHDSRVRGMIFSPDSSRIVTRASLVQMWDAKTGAPVGLAMPNGDGGLKFSQDGSQLFFGLNNRLRSWDARTGASLGDPMPLVMSRQAHTSSSDDYDVSPDGTRVVTVDEEQIARIWDVSHVSVAATSFEPWLEDVTAESLTGDPKNGTWRFRPLDHRSEWEPRHEELGKNVEWVRFWSSRQDRFQVRHEVEAAEAEIRGDWIGAKFHLEETLKTDPNSARAHVQLANVRAELGDLESAAALFEGAVTLDPADCHTLARLAVLAVAGKDLPAAQKHVDRLQAALGVVGPVPDPLALKILQSILPIAELGNRPFLMELAEQINERSLPFQTEKSLLALANYRAGKFQEAIDIDKDLVRPDRQPPLLIQAVMAMAHQQLGNAEEAKSWLSDLDAALKVDLSQDPRRERYPVRLRPLPPPEPKEELTALFAAMTPPTNPERLDWQTRVLYQQIKQEAAKLRQGAAPATR